MAQNLALFTTHALGELLGGFRRPSQNKYSSDSSDSSDAAAAAAAAAAADFFDRDSTTLLKAACLPDDICPPAGFQCRQRYNTLYHQRKYLLGASEGTTNEVATCGRFCRRVRIIRAHHLQSKMMKLWVQTFESRPVSRNRRHGKPSPRFPSLSPWQMSCTELVYWSCSEYFASTSSQSKED
jgi:hypothetical protein